MHFYNHVDVKKAVTLGKLKIMKHPKVTHQTFCQLQKFIILADTFLSLPSTNFDQTLGNEIIPEMMQLEISARGFLKAIYFLAKNINKKIRT